MIKITREQSDNFRKFISCHDKFIVTGHKEPDGDCLSSCLGIAYILDSMKKPYMLINAGPFKRVETKKFAPLFSPEVPFMSREDRNSTGLIIVDCSEMHRLGDISEDLKDMDTFIVDHHKTSDLTGDKVIIDPESPAAAYLVQQLIEVTVGNIDTKMANTLLFGMSTDTGYFRYLKTDSADFFRATARLVDSGANPREIYQEMTNGKPWNTRKLLGIMLEHSERHCNGKLVLTYETQEDTKKFGKEGRDTDALYSLMLEVEGVEAVAFVRQDTEATCTMGLRSKDKCDVSQIAAKFGGGGHKNASGASLDGKLAVIMPQLIKEFSKVL